MKCTTLLTLIVVSQSFLLIAPVGAANRSHRPTGISAGNIRHESVRPVSNPATPRRVNETRRVGSFDSSKVASRNHLRNLANGGPWTPSGSQGNGFHPPVAADSVKHKPGPGGFVDSYKNPTLKPVHGIKVGGCFPPSCPPPSCPPPSCPKPPCPPKCPPKPCGPWWPPICITPPVYQPPCIPTAPYPLPVEFPVVVQTPVLIEQPVVVETPVVVPVSETSDAVEIESVKEESELPQLAVGSTVNLKATELGEAPGHVILQVDALAMPAEVKEWNSDSVVTTLPMMGLAKPVKAQIHLVNAEGIPVNSLEFLLVLPAPEGSDAGQVETMEVANN